MSVETKLSQDLEREVAVAYLCSVNAGHIRQRWDVSKATTESNIVGKRSREWQDPLIEFYRQTKPHDKLRNAIHLYLAFNGQCEGLTNGDLIGVAETNVYNSVNEVIFEPRTKKLINETNLERILEVPKPVPDSKEQKLLRAAFGEPDTYYKALKLVNPLIYEKLREAYKQEGKVNIDNVYAQVANEIYLRLQSVLYLNPEATSAFNKYRQLILSRQINAVLETLPPREAKILRLRFGIGVHPRTLEEVSRMSSVTRQRIRQLEAKALRRLRHPSRSKKLRGFLELP